MELTDDEITAIQKNDTFQRIGETQGNEVALKKDLEQELHKEQEATLDLIMNLEARSRALDNQLGQLEVVTVKLETDINQKMTGLKKINENLQAINQQRKSVTTTHRNYEKLKGELTERNKLQQHNN